MNREGAETCLRLLAEAAMRGSLTAAPEPPWAAGREQPGHAGAWSDRP